MTVWGSHKAGLLGWGPEKSTSISSSPNTLPYTTTTNFL